MLEATGGFGFVKSEQKLEKHETGGGGSLQATTGRMAVGRLKNRNLNK